MKMKLIDISNKISKGSTPRGKVNYSKKENNYFLRVTDMIDLADVYNSEFTLSDEDINNNKMKMWPINTILVSIEGTVGKISILKKEMSFNQAVAGIIPNEEIINPRYLMYYLRTTPVFSGILKGTIMPALRLGDLSEIEIEVPSMNTQNKLVSIVDSITNKINLNNEINNNLYEFNNKLFEEKILNNAEKDDWEEYLLSDVSKMINGYSYKGNELVEKSNIGMATIKNFERTGGFKLDGFKDIVPQKCKSDHYVKPFEILVACTDLTQNADIIGNAIMLSNNADYDEIIMSMDLVKLIPITDIVNNYMLYAIVNSKDFKNFTLRYKSGTTVLHLNKNCFKEYTIRLPNYNTIKDLSKVFEGNYKKISQIVDENRKLEQLRDTLLPKLMNGEIDLDNIEV